MNGDISMKYAILVLALCSGNVCYAENLPSPDGKPAQPEVRRVYADECQGNGQPHWCAQARNDANVQGSTGGSDGGSE
jgi:hypothetical protein